VHNVKASLLLEFMAKTQFPNLLSLQKNEKCLKFQEYLNKYSLKIMFLFSKLGLYSDLQRYTTNYKKKVNILTKMPFFQFLKVVISPNLRSFGINIYFAVHWNPYKAK